MGKAIYSPVVSNSCFFSNTLSHVFVVTVGRMVYMHGYLGSSQTWPLRALFQEMVGSACAVRVGC